MKAISHFIAGTVFAAFAWHCLTHGAPLLACLFGPIALLNAYGFILAIGDMAAGHRPPPPW